MRLISKRNTLEEILALIYNKSIQGRFVTGIFTMPVLLSCALALWLFVAITGEFRDDVLSSSVPSCNFLTRSFSLLCYMAIAFILNHLHLFERRVGWLMSLFIWLVALSTHVSYDFHVAFSALSLAASVAMLFSCQVTVEHERVLFAVFALIGSVSLLMPVLVLMLPVLVSFAFISNIITVKRGFAMLLGLLTPFWLLFGATYVYEPAHMLFSVMQGFFAGGIFMVALPPSHILLSIAAELLVLVPASVFFFSSSSPGKPILRKRLCFILLLNSYLMLLSFLLPLHSELLYACRIPGTAVLMSYLFIQKITKLSNIYFIFVNMFWFAIALYSLWMGLF